MIEGGIRKPNVPDPASVPMIIRSSYPRRVSSGTDMRPTVAVVAADEPETAANSAQPKILACRSRPGSRVVSGARPENMSDDSRERNRISPIQMNIGSAVRSQMLSAPQTLVPNTSSAGAVEASIIAASATAMRENPTQRPSARQPKRITTRISDRSSMPIGLALFLGLGTQKGRGLPAQHGERLVQKRDPEDHEAQHHHALRYPEREFRHAEGNRVERPGIPGLHPGAVEREGPQPEREQQHQPR